MILTILSGLCLVILGLAGIFGWERMGNEGIPAEMFMPVFFGVSFLICAGFSRVHFRHGLYGGLVMALLGLISTIVRLYQYEVITNFHLPKTKLILAMSAICIMQLFISWREIQKDRHATAPDI